MKCSNCNTERASDEIQCSECGAAVPGTRDKKSLLRFWIILTGSAVIALCFAIFLMMHLIGRVKDNPVEPKKDIFYLKNSAVNHMHIDDSQPREVIPEFFSEQNGLAPIFLSGDGTWLFYPQGSRENADVYGYQLYSGEEERRKIASTVGMFTTNKDASKLYYLADHQLYAGNMEKFELIEGQVGRYFLNEDYSRIAYITTNGTFYMKEGDRAAKQLAENVSLRFVSEDLKIIYYVKDESLYLVKDGKTIIQVMKGNPNTDHPVISYIYENGDLYFRNGSRLYYYSCDEDVTKLVSKDFSYISAYSDNTYLYPYRTSYGGNHAPISICEDIMHNHIICRGAELLKKITGGYLAGSAIDPDGRDLYYIATNQEMDPSGDLFYVTIDESQVSESRRIASGVSSHSCIYVGDTFVYFRNMDDSLGDMYIDEKKIDTGVNMAVFAWSDTIVGPDSFLYAKNSREYFNQKLSVYYTMDTLMLYQAGNTMKISDNVTDFDIYDDKIIYLSVDDPDADSGALHLYEIGGEDRIIDTGVNAMIRPVTDREFGGEIDDRYREAYYYMGE
jgi:hypothetical protein